MCNDIETRIGKIEDRLETLYDKRLNVQNRVWDIDAELEYIGRGVNNALTACLIERQDKWHSRLSDIEATIKDLESRIRDLESTGGMVDPPDPFAALKAAIGGPLGI